MLKVLSRAPNDNFTFSLFTNLIEKISSEHEAYYIWSNPPDKLHNFLMTTEFSKPIVIIGIKDLLDMWEDFNFWTDKQQQGVILLNQVANKYSDKQFIIFTSHENLNLELLAKNINVIAWGGDLVNQADLYPSIEPVLDKNFNSTKTFISLNRNPRNHRLVLLSYLFGKEYNNYGIITFLGQSIPRDTPAPDNILDCMPWEFSPTHDRIRSAIIQGYSKFYNNKALASDGYDIYTTTNNNVDNFNYNLRQKYANSFVEIVTESNFSAPSFMLTEKTLNSFYGCNFPILLSGCGAVEHLRSLGFDMYDDIIDHSYDTVTNPFDRIVDAVEKNKELLLNSDYAKQVWRTHTDRIIQNVDVAKTIYNSYRKRAISQFNQLNCIDIV